MPFNVYVSMCYFRYLNSVSLSLFLVMSTALFVMIIEYCFQIDIKTHKSVVNTTFYDSRIVRAYFYKILIFSSFREYSYDY